MGKSKHKERNYWNDDWDHGEYYDHESAERQKKLNKRRREDKRSARQLPCERED
jgi:hypothetical protein